jgi:eukaryotic-like serine/threonine-protein kinase
LRQAFRNEARAWIRLGEHPNITKAFFFEELGPQLYITMAFVEGDDCARGPSLADRIPAGRLSLANICVWFCQVADGLAHAYACGIRAHRDIKPGNILIGRDNVARVSDFELAVTAELLLAGPTGDAAGTPLFMAPEQFSDGAGHDQRSDLYSLGVSLYQAASGGAFPFSPAFSPNSPKALRRYYFELRRMHEQAEPKRLASPLWRVIERCLRKRPEDRFVNLEAFRSALAEVARREKVTVPERSRPTDDFWVLRDQGNSLMRLGNYEEAIKAFDRFLAVLSFDGSVIFNRAVCLENLGRYAEALKVYETCANRGEVGGLVNGSNCLTKLGRREEALAYAKRAVETAPKDPDCCICLGNASYTLGRWEDAMRA